MAFTMISLLASLPAILLILAPRTASTQTAETTAVYQYKDSEDIPLNASLQQGSTNTGYMHVNWYAIPNDNITTEVLRYQLQYDHKNRLLQTGHLTADVTTFLIKGLETSTNYNVCLTIWYREDAQEYVTKLCTVMETIGMIRQDSINALCITIAVIILVVLSATIYWKIRVFKHNQKMALLIENEAVVVAHPDNGDIVGDGNHVHAKSISQRLSKRYSGYEPAQNTTSIEDRETPA